MVQLFILYQAFSLYVLGKGLIFENYNETIEDVEPYVEDYSNITSNSNNARPVISSIQDINREHYVNKESYLEKVILDKLNSTPNIIDKLPSSIDFNNDKPSNLEFNNVKPSSVNDDLIRPNTSLSLYSSASRSVEYRPGTSSSLDSNISSSVEYRPATSSSTGSCSLSTNSSYNSLSPDLSKDAFTPITYKSLEEEINRNYTNMVDIDKTISDEGVRNSIRDKLMDERRYLLDQKSKHLASIYQLGKNTDFTDVDADILHKEISSLKEKTDNLYKKSLNTSNRLNSIKEQSKKKIK